MKKALAGVLAVALTGVLVGSAMAQVPNIQVYFDPAETWVRPRICMLS